MAQIVLDEQQILDFARDKMLELSHDNVVEIHEDKLILNRNGEIYDATSVRLTFKKRNVSSAYFCNDVQKLICKHLNFELNEVIFIKRTGREFLFNVRFSPEKIAPIVVYDFNTAIQNMRDITDEPYNITSPTDKIGMYKRLGNSLYYFRWL